MNLPEFLHPDAVLFMHDQALREFGGLHGVRDEGMLHSALERAANKRHYDEAADLFVLAAAYAYGLARNHAFNDGNKRTAWACCVLFLRLNGVQARVRPAEAVETMVRLAAGEIEEAGFAAWLRQGAG